MRETDESAGWERVDEDLERWVTEGGSMTATCYRFRPTGRFPLHNHEQEQFVYCLSGSITFTIEGDPHRLQQNNVLLIAPSKAHSAVAGPEGAEVISVVAPARTPDSPIELLE